MAGRRGSLNPIAGRGEPKPGGDYRWWSWSGWSWDGGSVLAIYPRWSRAPTWQRLQTVRAALGSANLVLYGCSLPPLAGAVFGALAEALSEESHSPGSLLAALPQVEAQIVPIAWVSRLSGLPSPSMGRICWRKVGAGSRTAPAARVCATSCGGLPVRVAARRG